MKPKMQNFAQWVALLDVNLHQTLYLNPLLILFSPKSWMVEKSFFKKQPKSFLNSPKRSLRFETFYLDKYLLWHALNADDRDDDDDDDDQCDQICAKYCHFGNNLKVFGHLK